MRFHVIGLPFEPRVDCAYHGKVVRFARMMRDLGHEVFEYQAPRKLWDRDRVFDPNGKTWQKWNAHVIKKMGKIIEQQDFICIIAGRCQQQVAEAFPNHVTVEFGVGYGGVFAKYRVFESYAWMHTVYGALGGPDAHAVDGQFYDAVIPNYFDIGEFPLGNGGGGLGYMGRLIDRKGIGIAMEVAKTLGVTLQVAGEGEPPAGCNYHGVLGPKDRAEFLGGLDALLVPTLYIEPFGGVAVEAMLCGTPVITTDWGAFTETVTEETGWRCRTLEQFVSAGRVALASDRRHGLQDHARSRWGMEPVSRRYEMYFQQLMTLWGSGWYELSTDTLT